MKDDDPEFADSSSSENDDDTDVSSVFIHGHGIFAKMAVYV